MPRTPRNSPNPPGRPRNPLADEVVAEASRKGIPVESAAKRRGVPASTAHAAKARQKAAKQATASRSAAPAPSSPPGPSSPPVGSQAPVPGVAVSGRPDVLELVREILDARNPGARAELDEGLLVFARGDAAAFLAWKLRPLDAAAFVGDELAACRGGLGAAVEALKRAEPGEATLKAIGKVLEAANRVSVVAARRPREDGPDEVTRRLVAVHDQAVDRIGVLTSEEATDFARGRAELEAWLASTFGPIGDEAVRRLGVVLDGERSEAA